MKVQIKCVHIDGLGRRLSFSLSDAGFENVDNERIDARMDELRQELDLRTLSDGEVVETIEL